MTTTPPEAPTGPDGPSDDPGPRATASEIRDLGRLRRTGHDRKIAGVAGGLARHLDIDPLILRVAFVVLAFFGGAGLILYVACWLLVPEDGAPHATLTMDERSRTVALLLVGVLAAFALLGDTWGVYWFPWPLVLIALVAWLVLRRGDRRDGPGADDTTWSSPAYASGGEAPNYHAAVAARSRDPRKRGPVLFWFTLALIALACGTLGIVDVAGLDVADGAYPAVAVAITGVMLVIGAFFGRAGGLILVGLLATVGLVGATAAAHWDGERVTVSPDSAAGVEDTYQMDAGELVLDLSSVRDLESLDGRTITIEGNVGSLKVVLPEAVDADVTARVGGPGAVSTFGHDAGGIDTRVLDSHDGGTDVPSIQIDAELGMGEISVDTEPEEEQ